MYSNIWCCLVAYSNIPSISPGSKLMPLSYIMCFLGTKVYPVICWVLDLFFKWKYLKEAWQTLLQYYITCLFLLKFRGNLPVVHLSRYILYSIVLSVKFLVNKSKSHCGLYKGLNSPLPCRFCMRNAVRKISLYTIMMHVLGPLWYQTALLLRCIVNVTN